MARSSDSKFTDWFYEIDRNLLWCVLGLTALGVLAMITAGSSEASRKGLVWYFYFWKAVPFYFAGMFTFIVASFLNKKWILNISWFNVAVCFLLLLVTLKWPDPVLLAEKHAARWVRLPILGSVMPSDLMKPGSIMITAWFLSYLKDTVGGDIFTSKAAWRWDRWPLYLAFFAAATGIIFQHPDVGTFLLYFAVFVAMIFIAGLPIWILPALFVTAGAIFAFAFFTMTHIHSRVLAMLGHGAQTAGPTQTDFAKQSIQHGGLLGSGDDSFVKQSLPDSHTDFVFAAIVEDYGAIIGAILILVFLYVLRRLALDANRARDKFVFYAICGTFALFGTQVSINLLSTLNLFAPKGMTLPFISYGGSSFIAFCLLFGMVIALVREDKWKN